MIKLEDGPAEGAYGVKSAPAYLRAVVTPRGKKDVLDQPGDTAEPNERIYVYRREGEAGTVHIRMSGKSKRASGFYATGQYVHLADVDGEALRDNGAWFAWVKERRISDCQPDPSHAC